MTVHKLLEYNQLRNRFMRGPDNPLKYRAVVIDEASARHCARAALLSLRRPDARLLIVEMPISCHQLVQGLYCDLMSSASNLAVADRDASDESAHQTTDREHPFADGRAPNNNATKSRQVTSYDSL